jgi:hypothetical protein
MTEQTKFKVGDRVKYRSQYGTITKVDGSMYYNDIYSGLLEGNIWVKWDLHGETLHIYPSCVTLVQSAPNSSITEKIQQIEQQLQELKALLKD